jgi:hypothetical protein
VLRTKRGKRRYTAPFSNTALAHKLGKTHDWVALYYDSGEGEKQCAVVTAKQGPLAGSRVGQTKEFVKGVNGGLVEFGYSGQRSEWFKTDIKISDAQWLMQYLGRITDAQLREGPQSSGATPDEISCFIASVRNRIDQLKTVR